MLGTSKEKSGADFTSRSIVGRAAVDNDNALLEKVDLLFEKRHSIREAALTSINNTISLRVCDSCIGARQEHLADALHSVLQHTEEKESLLALRCASLAALSLEDGIPFKSKIEPCLIKLAKAQTIAPATRAAAIEALALVTFMNSVDSEHVLEIANLLSEIFYEDDNNTTPPAAVYCSAIDGWVLLLTTVEDDVIQQSLFPENIEKLGEFLDHPEYEVRVAAGKAIALLVEGIRNLLKDSQGEYEQIELSSIESPVVGWDVLLGKLDYLTMEKSKAQSKTEGKKQKKVFRELVASIENGHPPHESIQIRDVRLDLTTWGQITQLDRIRNYLGDGFMQHMMHNNNIMSIFEYHVSSISESTVAASQQPNKRERRRSIVEAEKVYTRYMDANRRARERDLSGFSSE